MRDLMYDTSYCATCVSREVRYWFTLSLVSVRLTSFEFHIETIL